MVFKSGPTHYISGQAKRRNRKAEENEFDPKYIIKSFTPDFEYYKGR